MVSTAPDARTLLRQQGIYERLLCNDCEQHINRCEMHAKRLFYDKMHHSETGRPNEIKVANLDYAAFKLFELSLLWRASIATNRFFREVNLGPHEDRIRRMLLQSDPGEPHEYGCAIIALLMEEKAAFDVILQPEAGRIDSHRCYRFILGGCIWLFIVSSHTEDLGGREFFLQPDGTLLLQSLPAKGVPFIRELVRTLIKRGKTVPGLAS